MGNFIKRYWPWLLLLAGIWIVLFFAKVNFTELNAFINEYALGNVIGRIILGVITSFIFVILLIWLFRPKVKISPNICKKMYEDEEYFVFKVVNMTRYDVYDVKFKLTKKVPYLTNRGSKINYRLEDVPLNKTMLHHVSRYRRDKGFGDHALLIRTKEDISHDIQDENITIKLMVTARHSFSNLSSVKTHLFTDPEKIHSNKEFKFGRRLDVT